MTSRELERLARGPHPRDRVLGLQRGASALRLPYYG